MNARFIFCLTLALATTVGCSSQDFSGGSRVIDQSFAAEKGADGRDTPSEDLNSAGRDDGGDDGDDGDSYGKSDSGEDNDLDQGGVDGDLDSDGDGKNDVDTTEKILGTKVDRVGVSFEDSTDKKDWNARDVFVCIHGNFKVDDSRTIKSASKTKQKARIVTYSGGACLHHIDVKVITQKGKVRTTKQVESRGVNETLDVAWYYGDKIEVSMQAYSESEKGQCLPLGSVPHTNPDAQRVIWYGGSCPAEVGN